MPELVDSHCHLDEPVFDADREQVLARARAAGVKEIIVPGYQERYWPRLRKVTAAYEGLYPAYGLHPWYLDERVSDELASLRLWLQREPCVAVGECGLDFYVKKVPSELQIESFVAQLKLAREFDLPVIVHARKSLDIVIKYLRRQPGLRGVVHAFSGSLQQAEHLFGLGFRLGLGGTLTFLRAKRLRQVAAAMPLEALLLETDAPFQPGNAHRGERNEPAYIKEVSIALAEIRGESAEDIGCAAASNARKLFGLSSAPE